MSTLPSRLAYVSFVSVADMMGLVHHIGVEKMLTELAAEIEADFLRWTALDGVRQDAARRLAFRGRCHRADADVGR